jgi:hypothetical protein
MVELLAAAVGSGYFGGSFPTSRKSAQAVKRITFDTNRKSAQAGKRTITVSVVTIGSTGTTLTLEKLCAGEPLDPS